jgi:hypothetical protein
MNFSAAGGPRKWAFGSSRHGGAAMVTIAVALNVAWALVEPATGAPKRGGSDDLFGETPPKLRGTLHATRVPLPKPRPAEAPDKAAPAEAEKQVAPEPPSLSACRRALTDDIAIAPSIPELHGPGGCGGTDLVRLEAVVLPNKHKVAVTPAATLRCAMASAIADWVRTDVAALAAGQNSEPVVLDNFDSYECRGFNRVPGAHLSEHGRANALDVRAIKLANGQSIELTDRSVPREVRESVLHAVCTRFTTVLGPGSDGYHENHVHLDLAERHNNYRICQWNVWDSLPQVAPLLPAERPEDAPPREEAKDGVKNDAKAR